MNWAELVPGGFGWNETTLLLIGWLLVDVAVFRWLWPVRKEFGKVPGLIRRAAIFIEGTCPHCGGEL
jgi:hypothetical protein